MALTKRRLFVLASLVLAATLLLGACAQPNQQQPAAPKAEPSGKSEAKPAVKAPASGGKLVVALTIDPDNLDGQEVANVSTAQATYPMYDTIVRYDANATKIVPSLAESWDISPDGLVYTFKLRKDAKFHDGTPVNAEALAFNFDRALNKDNPFNQFGVFPAIKLRYGILKSWEAPEAYTLKLTLKQPQATLLHYLTFSPVVSAEAVKKSGKEFPQRPVGSGPFKFVSWEKGVRLVYEKNPDYWGGAPKIDQLIIVPMTDPQARLTALQTGQVDFILGLLPDAVGNLKSNTNLVVQQAPSPHVWYMWMNQKRKPFDDVRVRQALNYAVNKKAIVDDILKGTAVVAEGPLSPVFGEWVEKDLKKYPYDPEKAKQLLKEAGLANGFSTTLMVPESGTGMQLPVAMATVIQANLAAVGVKADIQTLEFATFVKKQRDGDFDMSPYGFSSSVLDPDFIQALFHSSRQPPNPYNSGSYTNKEVDKLLMDARATGDQQKRVGMYRQIQKIVAEEAPWIFVDHENQVAAMNKKVKGFQLSPNFILYFDQTYIEP